MNSANSPLPAASSISVSRFGAFRIACLLSLTLCLCGVRVRAQGQEAASPTTTNGQSGSEPASAQLPARISGKVVDQNGAGVAGATVQLSREGQSARQSGITDNNGQFSFVSAPAGTFHLAITAAGFAPQAFSGKAQPGESLSVPPITLSVATLVTEVHVTPPTFEIAEAQIKEEEKQKALGFIPNFYVSYVPNAAPLAPRQKFELAWKTMVDPMTLGITGAIAGLQQAQNDFSGYGQGADGYAKRYGAAYADSAIGTLIGGAILPSLLHQDPRYFYKGTGSKKSRLMYALANAVICKGDNGKWQANYSGLLGGLAAGGISNLYYPPKDRDAGLTFQNFAIGIAASAAGNLLQEFVIKKLTPNLSSHDPNDNNGTNSKAHSLVGKAFSAFGSLLPAGD